MSPTRTTALRTTSDPPGLDCTTDSTIDSTAQRTAQHNIPRQHNTARQIAQHNRPRQHSTAQQTPTALARSDLDHGEGRVTSRAADKAFPPHRHASLPPHRQASLPPHRQATSAQTSPPQTSLLHTGKPPFLRTGKPPHLWQLVRRQRPSAEAQLATTWLRRLLMSSS